MNPNLNKLLAYPFERLARLKSSSVPPADLPHIALSIGEPKHAPPQFVIDVLRNSLKLILATALAGMIDLGPGP